MADEIAAPATARAAGQSPPSSPAATQPRPRAGRQGALLFSGFAAAQALSFLRNALLGHWLSPGDFGIAASITLLLQMLDVLSDVGTDRFLIQAADGDARGLQATAHSVLLARGLLTALAVYLAAGPMTDLLGIPEARWAFEATALAPAIRGLLHLDIRRYQRRLRNGPQILVELAPQLLSVLAVAPALTFAPGYAAVVWLSLLQAVAACLISHALAERPYRIGMDREALTRLARFGWPIWLSAFPLVAVYHGDRLIIGAFLGMETLAAYTVAFMVTMVPGLIAARVGNALFLPLLAEQRHDSAGFHRRATAMAEAAGIAAAGYLAGFVVAGGAILPLAFGPHYTGLGTVVSALAAMWAMRMIQSVPGIALMALGETKPLLWAGLVRAGGLALALAAVAMGYGLLGAALAATAAELASLGYITLRAGRSVPGLARSLAAATATLAPAAGLAALLGAAGPPDAFLQILSGGLIAAAVMVGLVLASPSMRQLIYIARAAPPQTHAG